MKNLIDSLGFGDSFTIKSVMAVKGLVNYDMIYVYHHLSAGRKVILKHIENTLNGDPVYSVNYRDFRLGSVVLTGIIKSFYVDQKEIVAEIAAVSKDKYLPIKKLDVELGIKAIKKAG